MPNLLDLLGIPEAQVSQKKAEDEDTLVSEAKAAPVRSEYNALLDYYKKNVPTGGLGGSAESRAKADLARLDELSSMPASKQSNWDTKTLADLKQRATAAAPAPAPITEQELEQKLTEKPAPAASPAKPTVDMSKPTLLADNSSAATMNDAGGPGVVPMKLTDALKTSSASPTVETGEINPEVDVAMRAPAGTRPISEAVQSSLQQGYADDLGDAALKGAQEEARVNRFLGMLGNAGAKIGAAIGGSKASNIGDKLIANADESVKEIKERRSAADEEVKHKLQSFQVATESEKADPNSSVSRMGQDLLKRLGGITGVPITADTSKMSWNQMQTMVPGLERLAGVIEGRAARAEAKRTANSDKTAKEYRDRYAKLHDALDVKRTHPVMANVEQKRVAAERLEGLLTQFPDGNIPKVPTRELSTSMASLLNTGNASGAAVTQVNELMPESAVGTMKDIAAWITNKPLGRDQHKFIKMYANTVWREKQIAERQLKLYRMKQASAQVRNMFKLDPESAADDIKQTLADYDIDMNDYERFQRGDRFDIVDGTWYAKDEAPKSTLETMAEGAHGPSHKQIKGDVLGSNKQPAKPKPGDIIKVKGKEYKIGPDGDSLIPVNQVASR